MYFPIGWPKTLDSKIEDEHHLLRVLCNRDRILFAVLSESVITIWYSKPQLPITYHRRSAESLQQHGVNVDVQWRPDSSMLVVTTSKNYLLFFHLAVDSRKSSLYNMVDSSQPALRRESPELFVKEEIPPLVFSKAYQIGLESRLTSVVCVRDELMVATASSMVLRYRWDGSINTDYCVDLRRTPFSVDQQVSIAVPIQTPGVHVIAMEYSPLVGGFAVVLSDGRAAFLTASSLKFDPNSVQGIWAQNITDATCASVSHKYRLIVFGRACGECVVCCVDETSGGLQVIHSLVLSSRDYPRSPGPVECLLWTPDGCALAVTWCGGDAQGDSGGISLWSVFGTLLFCSLGWERCSPAARDLEWGAEGYNLWMIHTRPTSDADGSATDGGPPTSSLMQLSFAKASQSVNPCMSNQERVCLQSEDRVYISYDAVAWLGAETDVEQHKAGSKQWMLVPVPYSYLASNWPVRYTAVDDAVESLAVAGRSGVARYSLLSRRWTLFGNENQERDFVVTGGLMWWNQMLVMGCYNLIQKRDEIRLYPQCSRLDNAYVQTTVVDAQVLLLNLYQDTLMAYAADSHITLFHLQLIEPTGLVGSLKVTRIQDIDISALTPHPACVVSISLSTLRMEPSRQRSDIPQSVLVNISGRLLMLQRDTEEASQPVLPHVKMFGSTLLTPTVLASMVESVWCPGAASQRMKLADVLWINSGLHGMRVWLPLFPQPDTAHNFMSKRIMLPFHCSIYPLSVKYDDAVILGAEADVCDFPASENMPPYCVAERTSQVYLQHILRQLLRRNLGHHAWEIAHRCTHLPYFAHALELLLHEVVEEEATSKEPIPDALLPRVIAFISEFPVYLETVVRCARKTEMALWSYLFASAGLPTLLFQRCIRERKLDTAASYLIILQNLETADSSRHHVTLLLDASLDECRWQLAQELTRFLRAIDPCELDSLREDLHPKRHLSHVTPPVSPNEEDLSMVYGTLQVRSRSVSTSQMRAPPTSADHARIARTNSGADQLRRRSGGLAAAAGETPPATGSRRTAFIERTLERHARKLLAQRRLRDLGRFAAHMEFRLVEWLRGERGRGGCGAAPDDPVAALRQLHRDFQWPFPVPLPAAASAHVRRLTPDSCVPLEERLGALHVNTSGGDSGYTSVNGTLRRQSALYQQRQPPPCSAAVGAQSLLLAAHTPSPVTQNATLMPRAISGGGGADTVSLLSDEGSTLTVPDEDAAQLGSPGSSGGAVRNSSSSSDLLELVSARGSQQAEVQLRYLLQLMQEAGCVEWSLLISLVLRDSMALIRTSNLASAPDAQLTLKSHLRSLHIWSQHQCSGYWPFLSLMHRQLLSGSAFSAAGAVGSTAAAVGSVAAGGSSPTDTAPLTFTADPSIDPITPVLTAAAASSLSPTAAAARPVPTSSAAAPRTAISNGPLTAEEEASSCRVM